MIRQILLFAFIGITFCFNANGQTPIAGVVNIYTPVVEFENADCQSHITVGSASGFREGDLILIIQMKGVTNATGYDTNGVGLFEFATVMTILGDRFTLRSILVNEYEVSGKVQCVRVPVYADANVVGDVTGLPWNGTTGGVIAMDVSGTLRLSANINANGLGFRGGTTWRGGAACSQLTANDVVSSQNAAMKGETFVDARPQQISGRQELYSGGGGGVSHNSGGGGGGNAGVGGQGGAQWEGCVRGFDNGGLGGIMSALIVSGMPRARAGAGGGAGHMNDNVGTSGSNGGGIVVIRCATVNGGGRSILANGIDVTADAASDAAGGGGAGGCIVLTSPTLLGGLTVQCIGGRGGNVRSNALHGPGGGGGGGAFIFGGAVLPPGLTVLLGGGVNGRNVTSTVPANINYLARPGSTGVVVAGVPVPESRGYTPTISVVATADTIVCLGTTVVLSAITQGDVRSITWISNDGLVAGTGPILSVQPKTSTSYSVTAVDKYGCKVSDTVHVDVSPFWNVRLPALNLGVLTCKDVVDTSLTFFNNSPVSATITAVTSASLNVSFLGTVPIVVRPAEFARIPIRILIPFGTSISANVSVAMTPCDTVLNARVSASSVGRSFTMAPTWIQFRAVRSCTGSIVDTVVPIRFDGATVNIVDFIEEGPIAVTSARSSVVRTGTTYLASLRWTPRPGATRGRLGVIVEDGPCKDTLWIDVDGPLSTPTINVVDLLDGPGVVLCSSDTTFVDIPYSVSDTVAWVVSEVSVTGMGSITLAVGEVLTGSGSFRVALLPLTVGPFVVTVTMRLLPCDTTVTVTIRSAGLDQAIEATQLLSFTEPVIGRRQMLQASYRNRGGLPVSVRSMTAPRSPFTIVRTVPLLPAILLPNDTLIVDVEILQANGIHLDSFTVEFDSPCPYLATTFLEGQASARTVVMTPDRATRIGVLDTVHVILVTRPEIDISALNEYTFSLSWPAKDLAIQSGSDARTRWDVTLVSNRFVVDVAGTWDKSDTLAQLPVTALLSSATVIPITFSRSPGFLWVGQQSNMEHIDGSLSLDDMCSGREIRVVSFTGIGALHIKPFPVSEVLELSLDDDRLHPCKVEIYNSIGSLVLTESFFLQRARNIDIQALPRGVYTLRALVKGETRILPLVIQ